MQLLIASALLLVLGLFLVAQFIAQRPASDEEPHQDVDRTSSDDAPERRRAA